MDVDDHTSDESDQEDFEDDSGSSEDASGDDQELEAAEIEKLEHSMKQGTATHGQLLKLVEMLSYAGEIERARACREVLFAKFVLSEQDWLSWLKEEVEWHKLATENASAEKRSQSLQNVLSLFERAVHEYESPKIWTFYTDTLQLNLDGDTVTVDRLRSTFEHAVEQLGLHATEAYAVRKSYREFEMTLLEQIADMESTAEAESEAKDKDAKAEQVERVAKLFRRELRAPHAHLDDSAAEYRAFCETWRKTASDTNDAETERLITEAKHAFSLIKEREAEAVVIASKEDLQLGDLLRFWNDYISFVRDDKSGSFSRSYIVHLYERAICEVSDLLFDENSETDRHSDEDWVALVTTYLDYLEVELRDRERYSTVLERATRLCYSSGTIWCRRMRDAERQSSDKRSMRQLCETALTRSLATASAYKDIWQAYLDCLQRRLFAVDNSANGDGHTKKPDEAALEEFRTAAQCGVDYVEAIGADVYGELARFWASCEARAGCMQEARDIWRARLFRKGFDQLSSYCVEQAELERRYADSKTVRAAFSKSLQTVTDYPQVVEDAFLRFEREEGTLDTFCHALRLVEQVRRQRARRAAAAEANNQNAGASRKKGKQQAAGASKSFESRKRKGQESSDAVENDGAKRSRFVASGTLSSVADASHPSQHEAQSAGGKKLEESAANKAKLQKRVEHDPSKDDVTVFISNLAFTADENTMKTEFESCGAVTDVRLVRNTRGQSKGYAYVQFANKSSVQAALALDRKLVDGRPMYVSPCDPSRTQTAAFRFASGLEPSKLFVRNLPLTITQQALENMFSEHGQLRGIRLVTFRNGRPKGIAYVEYANEASASKALVKMDGMLVGDREISVALSDPSASHGDRRTLADYLKDKRSGKYLKQLGAEEDEDGGSNRGQSAAAFQQPADTKPKPRAAVLAFAPRVSTVASKRLDLGVVVSRNAGAPAKPAAGGEQSQPATVKAGESVQQAKLSNDQFRQFLLKK